jgi:hypothetical protein
MGGKPKPDLSKPLVRRQLSDEARKLAKAATSTQGGAKDYVHLLTEEEQYVDLIFDLPPKHKMYYEDKRREVEEASGGASLTLLQWGGHSRESKMPDNRRVRELRICGLKSRANRAAELVLRYGKGVVPLGTGLYFEGWFQTAEYGRFIGTGGRCITLFEQVRILEDEFRTCVYFLHTYFA